MIPYRPFPRRRPRVPTGPTPEEKLAGIKECLYSGDHIQAIEIYREWKGVDLKEAKAGVEQLDREFMATSPQPFVEYAWRRGWVGVLVLILIALAVVIGMFREAVRV